MEINQTILGLIALFSVGISVFLGAVILGTFEQQTSGQCTEGTSSVVNSTVSNNVTNFGHGFLNTRAIEGTDASGWIQVFYQNKSNLLSTSDCYVQVGATGAWTALGYLTNISSGTTLSTNFTFAAASMGASMNINYSTCQGANITSANITYDSLTGSSCSYTYNAYKTIKQVNKNVTGVMSIASIIPYIMVIVIILSGFGAFLYLRKD
jgi:hypothetical protein